MNTTTTCPRCHSGSVGAHCTSPTCNWVICRSCSGYGKPDGSRFADLTGRRR